MSNIPPGHGTRQLDVGKDDINFAISQKNESFFASGGLDHRPAALSQFIDDVVTHDPLVLNDEGDPCGAGTHRASYLSSAERPLRDVSDACFEHRRPDTVNS